MSTRWYGMCPAQVDGIASDGRPFYFRARSGRSTLHVGGQGWVPNICGWPDYSERTLAQSWDSEYTDPDFIDGLIDDVVGEGWRHATYEERLYDQVCKKCGITYRSDGGNVCIDCLVQVFRGQL